MSSSDSSSGSSFFFSSFAAGASAAEAAAAGAVDSRKFNYSINIEISSTKSIKLNQIRKNQSSSAKIVNIILTVKFLLILVFQNILLLKGFYNILLKNENHKRNTTKQMCIT